MIDIELKAEVFRVIRANSDKNAKQISIILKNHFSDVDPEKLGNIIIELYQGN